MSEEEKNKSKYKLEPNEFQRLYMFKQLMVKIGWYKELEDFEFKKRKESSPNYVKEIRETLTLSGLHIKHTHYDVPVLKGFKRDKVAVDAGAKQRKKSNAIKKDMEKEIDEFAERYPDATRHDKKAIKELEKIEKKYAEMIPVREDNLRRKINKFRSIIQSNWDEWTHFITLSFKNNETNITKAKKKLERWIEKMRELYPDFIYAYVIEFQKRGAVHFHLICKLDDGNVISKKRFKEFRATWERHGGINIKGLAMKYIPKKIQDEVKQELESLPDHEKMQNVWSVGRYLTSYLEKDAASVRLFGSKLYGNSQGLKEEIKLTDPKKIANALSQLGVDRLKENVLEIPANVYDENGNYVENHDLKTTMKFYNVLMPKEQKEKDSLDK